VVTWWLEHDVLRSDTRGPFLAVALLTVDALVFCLVYLAVLTVFARSTVVTIVRSVPALIARFRGLRRRRARYSPPGPAGGVSIGEALADARRQAGLTVSCLSDRSRVRETIITDMESDDYSACGGDSYARGYIRIIARAVGADPEPLIREYNTARPVPQRITDDAIQPITGVRMPSGSRGR
jgi:Helix-turn-helix domain